MAHVGAITAAGIPRAGFDWFGCRPRCLERLRGDRNKFEFMSSGAAIGVAAAFGAALGDTPLILKQ